MSATKTISKAMDALGISGTMKSDPVIAKEILQETHLDDLKTNFRPMRNFCAMLQRRSRI